MEVTDTGRSNSPSHLFPSEVFGTGCHHRAGGHVEGVSSGRQEFLTHSQVWVLIPSWESLPHPRPADGTRAPQRAEGSRGERVTPLAVVGKQDRGADSRDDFYSCEFARVTSHDFLRPEGAAGAACTGVPSSRSHIPTAWRSCVHPWTLG